MITNASTVKLKIEEKHKTFSFANSLLTVPFFILPISLILTWDLGNLGKNIVN